MVFPEPNLLGNPSHFRGASGKVYMIWNHSDNNRTVEDEYNEFIVNYDLLTEPLPVTGDTTFDGILLSDFGKLVDQYNVDSSQNPGLTKRLYFGSTTEFSLVRPDGSVFNKYNMNYFTNNTDDEISGWMKRNRFYVVQVQQSANTFGDPHISTLNNKLYELSHDVKTYRMLQGNDIIINASTRKLNNIEKEEITQLEKKIKTTLIKDGVVYDKLFIKCDKYIAIYDFITRKFKINLPHFFRADGPWLIINSFEHGKIKLKITSGNIMNKYNFSIRVESQKNLTGLLVDEYLLESMEVKSLEETKLLTGIKGKNPVLSKLIKIKN